MFFNSSFTVSIKARFLSAILSCKSIKLFFIFFLILVIKCTPLINSFSNESLLIYFLSPKSFPKIFLCKFMSDRGLRSYILPAVIIKSSILPLSLMIRCSLNP